MRVLVLGGSTFIGCNLFDYIQQTFLKEDWVFYSIKESGLYTERGIRSIFNRVSPTHVIYLYPPEYDLPEDNFTNMLLVSYVMSQCKRIGVEKLISVIPSDVLQSDNSVVTEANIHTGSSEHTSTYIHRMTDIMAREYRTKYNCMFITVVAPVLYGPYDDFSGTSKKLIPDLITKCLKSKGILNLGNKLSNCKSFQYTFVLDFVKLLVWTLDKFHNASKQIILGDSTLYLFDDIWLNVKKSLDVNNDVRFDLHNDDFTNPLIISTKEMKIYLDENFHFTPLHLGIDRTIQWYLRNNNSTNVIETERILRYN